jgi:hypothetical protein
MANPLQNYQVRTARYETGGAPRLPPAFAQWRHATMGYVVPWSNNQRARGGEEPRPGDAIQLHEKEDEAGYEGTVRKGRLTKGLDHADHAAKVERRRQAHPPLPTNL